MALFTEKLNEDEDIMPLECFKIRTCFFKFQETVSEHFALTIS